MIGESYLWFGFKEIRSNYLAHGKGLNFTVSTASPSELPTVWDSK